VNCRGIGRAEIVLVFGADMSAQPAFWPLDTAGDRKSAATILKKPLNIKFNQ